MGTTFTPQPIPMAALDANTHQYLGEGHVIGEVDYGQDDHSYFIMVMDAGPVLYVRTDNARRATNWSAGYDPCGLVGKNILEAMSKTDKASGSTFHAIAAELARLPLSVLNSQVRAVQDSMPHTSLSVEVWEEALLIHTTDKRCRDRDAAPPMAESRTMQHDDAGKHSDLD